MPWRVDPRQPSGLNDLDAICSRVDAIWNRYQTSGDEYYIDAAALNVHDFYARLERIFESIARQVDQSMPNGPHWHEDLLDQMASSIPSTFADTLEQLANDPSE